MEPAGVALLLGGYYAALLLDTISAPPMAIGSVTPDWPALVLLVWLLGSRLWWSTLLAGAFGALADLAAGGRVGPGVIAFALAGYAVPRMAAKMSSRSIAGQATLVGMGTLGIGFVVAAIAYLAAELDRGPADALTHVAATAVYTALLAVPILMARQWMAGQGAARPRAKAA